MRRLVAMLALSGLVSSPVVAQTRLFCRFTGIEVVGCAEREAPAAPVVKDAGCCEHRAVSPLACSRVAPSAPDAVPVWLPSLPGQASVAPPAAAAAVSPTGPDASTGPPLFVQHRALLI